MKIALILFSISFFLVACKNKIQETEPMFFDEQPTIDSLECDTTYSTVETIGSKDDDKASASSYLHISATPNAPEESDNMRGFDPASEDDMDDNGMSRYMENDDEEGWD